MPDRLRTCPECGDPMDNLGIATDDEGHIVTTHRCPVCDLEWVDAHRPPDGWRQEWRDRIAAWRKS